MSDETSSRQTKLNQNSYINLSVMAVVIAATLWIKDGQTAAEANNRETANALSQYKELQNKDLQILNLKLSTITELLQVATKDPYNRSDARRQWKQFSELNPSLRVPELQER